MTPQRKRLFYLMLVLLIALGLAVLYAVLTMNDEEDDEGEGEALTVSGAWGRAATSGTTTGAFMVIANADDDAERLTAASAPADLTDTVEIHETTVGADNVMQMRPVEGIDVPAKGSVELKPGGYHIMLLDLKRDLAPGDSVDLTLTFESGASLTVTAEVRAMDATGAGS